MDILKIVRILYDKDRFMTLNEIYEEFRNRYNVSGFSDYKAAIRSSIYRNCINRDINTKNSKMFVSCLEKCHRGQKYGLYEWLDKSEDVEALMARKLKEKIDEENDTNYGENNIYNDEDINYKIENDVLIKFYGNGLNNNYIIPDGVKIIEKEAFSNNTILCNLEIPDTVTTINDKAFANCKNISSLNLPKSIVYIGENVFDGCENLETIFCETKAVKKLLTNLPKKTEIICLE